MVTNKELDERVSYLREFMLFMQSQINQIQNLKELKIKEPLEVKIKNLEKQQQIQLKIIQEICNHTNCAYTFFNPGALSKKVYYKTCKLCSYKEELSERDWKKEKANGNQRRAT